MLLIGAMSYGQTALLGTATASPGEAVVVPLTVGSWTNTGAITLNIKFKPNYLSFTGITGAALSGYTVNSNDSMVMFVWTHNPGVNFNGLLFNLNFIYNGASSTPVHFLPSCQVADASGNMLTVTWTDGAVNPNMLDPQTATLTAPTATTGSSEGVVLKFAGFPVNVGSITQKIHYDPTQLAFAGITSTNNLAGAIANALNGVVTITWSKSAGADINFSTGNSITLNFQYTGSTCTAVTFNPGCIITDKLLNNIAVSYTNGMVCPGTPVGNAVLGTVLNAVQGNDYNVPLNFTTLPSISSLTLHITFDSPRLSYIGANSLLDASHTLVNVNGNTITIVYTNTTPVVINTLFLNLKFKYNGVGTAFVSFGPGCFFTDASINAIQVGYTNGSISPGIASANANIGYVNANTGTEVDLPVTFSSLPTTMGAVTLFIGFDPTMLTYIGVMGNTHGATNWSPTAGQVNIAWASATSTDLNGTFLSLRFIYNGGGGSGGCGGTQAVFKDGCELDDHNAAIVAVNWKNGGVNYKFKISGYVTYDNNPNPNLPLGGVKVYAKDGAEPIPPLTTPIPNKIDSVTTDGTGYFEIYVLSNTYYLYASNSAARAGIGPADVVNLRNYVANILPNTIVGDPLRVRAADLNQDGLVNGADLTILKNDIAHLPNPNFTAPNWMFTNPQVIVNCADVSANLSAICAGDVNGSYPNP